MRPYRSPPAPRLSPVPPSSEPAARSHSLPDDPKASPTPPATPPQHPTPQPDPPTSTHPRPQSTSQPFTSSTVQHRRHSGATTFQIRKALTRLETHRPVEEGLTPDLLATGSLSRKQAEGNRLKPVVLLQSVPVTLYHSLKHAAIHGPHLVAVVNHPVRHAPGTVKALIRPEPKAFRRVIRHPQTRIRADRWHPPRGRLKQAVMTDIKTNPLNGEARLLIHDRVTTH